MNRRRSSPRQSRGAAIGEALLKSVREMKAGKAARISIVEANDVALARQNIGLSQADFAELLCISKRTLQDWEQGRRSPSGAAQALIRIARRAPGVFRDAFD